MPVNQDGELDRAYCKGFPGFLGALTLVFAVACGSDELVRPGIATAQPDTAAGIDAETDAVDPGCQTDDECAAAGQVCDSLQHICIACRTDADCGAGLHCHLNACGPLVPCQSDKACAGTAEVCDPVSHSCVACMTVSDCGDGLDCIANACRPPAVPCQSSKECTATSQVCDKPAGHCVDCLANPDCAADHVCLDGACRAGICKAGEITCQSGGLAKCAADGNGWSVLPCPADQTCLGSACIAATCSAGSATCSGDMLVTCKPDGSGWGAHVPCGNGTACKAGVCVAAACKPGEQTCASGAVLTCDAAGTGWQAAACPGEGKFVHACAQIGSTATCTSTVCKPALAFCAGAVALACGVGGIATVTADCALPGANGAAQICSAGACVAQKCTPGAQKCADASTLATCDASGMTFAKTPCGEAAACAGGSCKPLICKPGMLSCEGSLVRKCNDSGTALASVKDCADASQLCSAGECVAASCTAGSKQCQAGKLAICKANNAGWTQQDCPAGQTCIGAACQPMACTPGQKSCVGKTVVTCNDQGSGTTVTQDCAAIKLNCVDGDCGEKACQPGAVACVGDSLGTCKANGQGWNLQSCADTNLCTDDICDAKTSACMHPGKTCDDGNACTADGCSFGDGQCGHTKVNAACDVDGSACTADACSNGVCKPGAMISCDDNNPCTLDSCDGAAGLCGHDAKAMDGKACGGGALCAAGQCGVVCKNGNDCPAGCACGGTACVGKPKPSTAFTIDTPSVAAGWHAFHNQWWFAQPNGLVCRYDAATGKVVSCFDSKLIGISQIWGDAKADYAYVATTKSVVKWKGQAEQVLWTYNLADNSSASIKGVAADDDFVYFAPTWGPTNIERLHKLSGAWAGLVQQGMAITLFNGLAVYGGVAYLGAGSSVTMVDMLTAAPVKAFSTPAYGLAVRGNLLCVPTGQTGSGNLPCWDMNQGCPLP